jgi:glycosyltransferase involved in cell wall biosynthesis
MVRNLAEELAERNFRVLVLTGWRRDEPAESDARIRVQRIRPGPFFFPAGSENRPWLHKWLWRLQNIWNVAVYFKTRTVLRRERPDLINIHNYAAFSPAVFSAANRSGVPVVFTAHDYFPLCRHYSFVKKGRICGTPCPGCRAWAAWNLRFLRKCAWVFLSEKSRSIYAGHVHPERALLFPNPLFSRGRDIEHNRTGKKRLRRRNPDRPLEWLFLGRLDALKGIEAVLRAWSRLPAVNGRLRIAGSGPLSRAVSQWASHRPGVEFLGYVSGRGKHRVMLEADIMLVPSGPGDVSPLVIPEALGYGLPLLGPPGGILDEVIDPGKTGWFCDVADSRAFSRLVAELFRNPAEVRAMSDACFAAAEERISAEMMPRLTTFFGRLIERKEKIRG